MQPASPLAFDGKVYFTEFALDRLAKLDPQTGKITEFQENTTVPGERADKHAPFGLQHFKNFATAFFAKHGWECASSV